MTPDEITGLLGLAVTAPSGDNSQPWWFHIADGKLEVHLYPDRDNAILNYRLSGSYVAMGALIENVSILAAEKGYSAKISLFPETNDEHMVARIAFEKGADRDPLVDHIADRVTNRKPHKKETIPDQALERIRSAGDSVLPGRIELITDRRSVDTVGKASSIMERVALETPAIHKLFFESLVWDDKEETRRGVGLPLKTTELPPPVQLLFRAIRDWKIAKALNRIGLSVLAGKANGATYSSSAAIGIVSTDSFEREDCVVAGRIFQRAWLAATREGLAFQPVTGLLFLGRRVEEGATDVFEERHVPMIREGYREICDAFSLSERSPIMLFRIGYADAPSARTKRKPPEIR
jgi:nitroreductase